MTFVQNFPFFCIILSMFSAIISFVLNGKTAKWVHLVMVTAVLIMSACVLQFTVVNNVSYTYMMGHYPAPWGNEIRIGSLEALMALAFAFIMLLSVLGGIRHIEREIPSSKQNLFYILMNLLMSSLLALIYTNDLFTAYVFIEICTIAACGLIMAKKVGRVYVSAVRYMIMSLVGSGLFLIGLTLLYSITGHLLMTPAKEALERLMPTNSYTFPLTVILLLMTIGLAIKSGLYPFHTWIPDAYGYTTPAASAVLSSLVSKGYIFLLVKLIIRVLPYESEIGQNMTDVMFVFGIIGMIMGSVDAIRENNIRRMTSFSSVAQIGYIFMGIGFSSSAGVTAALFHVISHGAMKALLFISIAGLCEASDDRTDRVGLCGAGFRQKIAGVGFTVGSLSMIGMPLLTGFVSKYLFAAAATTATPAKMIVAWIALAISTTLNAVYFMRNVLIIYTAVPDEQRVAQNYMPSKVENWATIGLVLVNFALGMASEPVIVILEQGVSLFS